MVDTLPPVVGACLLKAGSHQQHEFRHTPLNPLSRGDFKFPLTEGGKGDASTFTNHVFF